MTLKIKQYGLLAVLGLSLALTSCKKNLELQNEFGLTPTNAFTDLASYSRQLSGVYGTFAGFEYYNGYTMVTDVLADDCYETIESLVNFNQVHNWLYDASDRQRTFFTSMWRVPYNVVLQSNYIINGIDAVKSENERFYNRILGQALAARAIAHFDVLKAYSDNLDRTSTSPGIPYKTDTRITYPARLPVREVYDSIYSDLNRAITLLGNVDVAINSGSNRGFLDIWGARAALAKVALYAKDYATAIQQSSLVIAQFPLATRSNFPGIWNDSRSDEVIWAIQNNSGDPGSPFPSAELMSFRANRNTFGVLPAFISTYDTSGFAGTGIGRDIRFTSYYFLRNAVGGANNWGISKFRGKGTSSDNLVNFKVFRVSEMYLIRAEAYALSSPANPTAANADLSALKTARIDGYTHTALTGAALVSEIAAERRRELSFEGHRWFDLKRTTRVVNRPLTGTGNPNPGVQSNLPSSSHRWVWPIPEVEMRANPQMQQNSGYL
ncbi:MAG TPA: RagB/SusD family nutrient uptake outer membrane protein [Lacibacter sp.]|nr:RagB/SusD family nutrient uptake outer membrane protein [Lacibacter sp.]HMO88630.1 RagB/SusD family nutrient uptake outer membrane protein [Lacibacter sp.]HMP88390.1 RagB/SusD family nutrient uptake outer membrane protein [Lacibacter sp.]